MKTIFPNKTISWNVNADGDWATAADWSSGQLPNDADDVTIDTAGLHTVTHGAGTDLVRTLMVGNDDFTVSGGSLTINFTSSFANLLTVSGGTLKFTGASVISSLFQSGGTVAGAGAATVTGPASFTATMLQTGPGTTLLKGASTLAGGAKLYLDGGRVLENQGTVVVAGAIELGGNPFGAALGGATIQNDAGGVIDIQAPVSIDDLSGTVAFHNAGTLEQTGTVGVSQIHAPVDNGGIIVVKTGTLSFAGGLANLSGTTLTGGTYEVDAGATLQLPDNVTVVTLDGVVVFKDPGPIQFQSMNTATGQEVGLQSTLTTIGEAGRLELVKAAVWASTQAISNSGTIDLGAGSVMTASLSLTPTGVVKLEGGTLSLTGASVLAGAITGKGALDFSGGTEKVNNGARIAPETWTISGGAAVTISEKLTSASDFSQSAGTILSIDAGEKLSLTGAATLAGAIDGAGTVALSNATIDDVTLGGSATLSDVGVVDQTGDLTIGVAGSTGATLVIAAGATWRIDNDHGAANPGPINKSIIRNSGLFIKSGGAGTSIIAVKFADLGMVEAASGVLDFTGKLTGAGALAVDAGATLEARSAASSLSMSFNGGDGTLALGKPAKFAATINGFSATDAIDLVKTLADAATLGPGDTLSITNGGAAVATLQLAGDYTGATFSVTSDGAGGSIIVVTPAGGATGAPGQRLVAAMAGLGGGGGGLDRVIAAESWRGPPPGLAAPRMHVA